MPTDPEIDEIATALRVNVGMLVRRLRQHIDGALTMPETSALARLDRSGDITAAELARLEQISPQSIGATVSALESRGLVSRRPDPGDGRRVLISVTKPGLQILRDRRNQRTQILAEALATSFTRTELKQLAAAAPLIERLAQSI
jgi:DNA-binding MarR family transcriptional regulator